MTSEDIMMCPSCGCDCETLYAKYAVSGSAVAFFNVNEQTQDFRGFHDNLVYRGGKYLYCPHCDKKICKADEFNLSEFEPVGEFQIDGD